MKSTVYGALLGAAMLVWLAVLSSTSIHAEEDFQTKVDKAVAGGVEYLKKEQKPNGGWGGVEKAPLYPGASGQIHDLHFGIAALVLQALLESDVPVDDPVIVKGFDFLQKERATATNPYEAACGILAVESKYSNIARKLKMDKILKAKPEKRAAMAKEPLVVNYALDAKDKALVAACLATLHETFKANQGGWRYGNDTQITDGDKADTSSTQYSILGLLAADKMGFKVQDKCFQGALKFFLDTQEKDGPKAKGNANNNGGGNGGVETPGPDEKKEQRTYVADEKTDRERGWAYIRNGSIEKEKTTNGSMTVCGICGLIMCKSYLSRKDPNFKKMEKDVDQAIFDGLAYLGAHWSVQRAFQANRSHYYYLYGLERIGMLGQLDKLAGHEWYPEGAKWLVNNQKGDGSWFDNTELDPEDRFGTAFALLFLKKGTREVKGGAIRTR